jgi:hypothetical protein
MGERSRIARSVQLRCRAVRVGGLVLLLAVPSAAAQEHVHGAPDASQGGAAPAGHSQHQHDSVASLFPAHEASGTSWVPAATPMYGAHLNRAGWQLMVHGQGFVQFLYESGEVHRTSHQAGSINWAMGMARRPVGGGWLGLRGMLSAEPWTIAGCGYPDLLATGETCDGDSIHDRQHPHDFVMELAAEYERPLPRGLRWHLYGGLAGEPALGPPAYPHRLSAMGNPVAPIGHHWLDATHIVFGVVTSGVSSERWRAEASLFNGREPDEHRAGIEAAAWDSFSGRVSFRPDAAWAVQVSAGRLNDAERLNAVVKDITRLTASVTHQRQLRGRPWATTAAWGRNREPLLASHALLLESAAGIGQRDLGFARFELAGKPAHDLHVHEVGLDVVYRVGKLQLGYLRDVLSGRGLVGSVGGSLSLSMLPDDLAPRYGGRVAPGVGVFLSVRPSSHAAP